MCLWRDKDQMFCVLLLEFWKFNFLMECGKKKNNLIFMGHFSVLCAIVCHSFLESTFPCTLVHVLLVKDIFSINTTIYLSHKISCVWIDCYSLSIHLVFPRVCILLVSLFQLYIFLRCSPLEAGASWLTKSWIKEQKCCFWALLINAKVCR